jgi:hypothetical protein
VKTAILDFGLCMCCQLELITTLKERKVRCYSKFKYEEIHPSKGKLLKLEPKLKLTFVAYVCGVTVIITITFYSNL